MGINVLSLFDGMSCGMLALNKAGIEIDNYFASEIDKYAMKVSGANFPAIKQIGSVIDIDASELPKIDLLIGGSPCQGFSFAGKREGMVTACKEEITTLERYLELKTAGFEFSGQSYLFWEYVRLFKKTKPTFFFLENVKMKKENEKIITDILGVEPIEINSNLVSAQNRKRLYWTNIANITKPRDKSVFLRHIVEGEIICEPSEAKQFIQNENPRFEQFKKDSPALPRIIKNLRGKNDKTQCLLASIYKGMAANGMPNVISNSSGQSLVRKLTPLECERLQTVPDNYTNHVSNSQRYKMLGNGWTVDVIAHCFSFLPIYMAKKCECIAWEKLKPSRYAIESAPGPKSDPHSRMLPKILLEAEVI